MEKFLKTISVPTHSHRNVSSKKLTHGTGGSLREVETSIQGDEFWVVNGDLFLQTDLSQMLAFHRERQVKATVGSWRIHQTPWEMERIEIGRDGDINDIQRIHPSQEKRSTLRPVGLYLFNSAVLDLSPQGGTSTSRSSCFATLREADAPAKVWEITGVLPHYFKPGRLLACEP